MFSNHPSTSRPSLASRKYGHRTAFYNTAETLSANHPHYLNESHSRVIMSAQHPRPSKNNPDQDGPNNVNPPKTELDKDEPSKEQPSGGLSDTYDPNFTASDNNKPDRSKIHPSLPDKPELGEPMAEKKPLSPYLDTAPPPVPSFSQLPLPPAPTKWFCAECHSIGTYIHLYK